MSSAPLTLKLNLTLASVVGPLANLSSGLYGAKADYGRSFTVTVLQGEGGVRGEGKRG